MKMSDIGFLLKTELTSKFKIKNQFPQFGFQKTDFGGLWTFFHVVSFTIHLLT